jgi:hypothetical protein
MDLKSVEKELLLRNATYHKSDLSPHHPAFRYLHPAHRIIKFEMGKQTEHCNINFRDRLLPLQLRPQARQSRASLGHFSDDSFSLDTITAVTSNYLASLQQNNDSFPAHLNHFKLF